MKVYSTTPMDISIIICTRNRADSLSCVLRSIAALKVPYGLCWEVLVVDNGSEDQTSEVVASYAPMLPIVSAREAQPGLSNARNAGVRHARGRYMLWTDDDVRVHEDWLIAYLEAFQSFPDGAVFGGSTVPVLERPTPAWFDENQAELEGLLAYREPSALPRRLTPRSALPYGLNFAIRAVEQRMHLYDPMLGVAPGRRRVGEETQVMKAILATGAAGYWVPDAKVFHIIPTSRQTLKYVKLYYRGQGETSAVLRELGGQKLGIRTLLRHSRRAARDYLSYWVQKGDEASPSWIRHYKRFAYQVGVLGYLFSADRPKTRR
jgi:glycosyltransferase involved in cell wall biosynthesis